MRRLRGRRFGVDSTGSAAISTLPPSMAGMARPPLRERSRTKWFNCRGQRSHDTQPDSVHVTKPCDAHPINTPTGQPRDDGPHERLATASLWPPTGIVARAVSAPEPLT